MHSSRLERSSKRSSSPGSSARHHNFTNPVCEVDLRPGGAYHIVVRDPEGTDYPVRGVYQEIVEPDRLVFTVGAHDHPPEWREQLGSAASLEATGPDLHQVWTVLFEEHEGKTKLTVHNRFDSTAIRDAALKLGHAYGVSESLDRLEQSLTSAPRG